MINRLASTQSTWTTSPCRHGHPHREPDAQETSINMEHFEIPNRPTTTRETTYTESEPDHDGNLAATDRTHSQNSRGTLKLATTSEDSDLTQWTQTTQTPTTSSTQTTTKLLHWGSRPSVTPKTRTAPTNLTWLRWTLYGYTPITSAGTNKT